MDGLDDIEAFNVQYVACKGTAGRLKRLQTQAILNPLSKGQLNPTIKNAMLDDLRRSRLEKWCKKHGHQVKFELKDKIALRKWFYSLDSDGSGEVNAEELQDPMLSTGILKTKQQVFNTLQSIDKSKSSIDFDTFSKTIRFGQFADQAKLKKLQSFCENEHGFCVDTLFSIERRRLLFDSIMLENQKRMEEMDNIWKSNASYESKLSDLRQKEDAQAANRLELDMYVEELQDALQLNKKDAEMKEKQRLKELKVINMNKSLNDSRPFTSTLSSPFLTKHLPAISYAKSSDKTVNNVNNSSSNNNNDNYRTVTTLTSSSSTNAIKTNKYNNNRPKK